MNSLFVFVCLGVCVLACVLLLCVVVCWLDVAVAEVDGAAARAALNER